MQPGYWGANYFSYTWWRIYYWFENTIGSAAAQIIWGYKPQLEKLTNKKEVEERIEALEQEIKTKPELNLLGFTNGLRAKLEEPNPFEENLKQILLIIELKRQQALENEELEELALIMAMV
jgi:hypothetical protein